MTTMTFHKADWIERYQSVSAWLRAQGQALYATRIDDILAQTEDAHVSVVVAFCGLFSAGKSSLINALCQSQALATGAVPTTADVASVILPGSAGVCLLDTPGVDSTDESHREATMNALHKADAIVLVADYQHVEAEENLELLREFTEEGKQVVFVVNQIDKHLDFELPFKAFQEHVEESLEDYGIDLNNIFYTSTAESPYNELKSLLNWLVALGEGGADVRVEQIQKRIQDVIHEAVAVRFEQKRDEAIQLLVDSFGQRPIDDEEVRTWLAQEEKQEADIEGQLQSAYQAGVELRKQLREQWVRLVELAQIAPYETTEKGRVYVESLRGDFKVGFFRSGKKTAEEQRRRAELFVEDIGGRLETYLLVPLRNQIAQDLKQMPGVKPDWTNDVKRIEVTVDVPYVERLVKQGALVSSQYPYQYVKDVVARIKRDVLAQMIACIDTWFGGAKDEFFREHESDRQRVEAIRVRIDAAQRYLNVREDERRLAEQLCAGEVKAE